MVVVLFDLYSRGPLFSSPLARGSSFPLVAGSGRRRGGCSFSWLYRFIAVSRCSSWQGREPPASLFKVLVCITTHVEFVVSGHQVGGTNLHTVLSVHTLLLALLQSAATTSRVRTIGGLCATSKPKAVNGTFTDRQQVMPPHLSQLQLLLMMSKMTSLH